MSRSRRATFSNAERVVGRGHRAAREAALRLVRCQAANDALDILVEGHEPAEAHARLRALQRALPERLGLTLETASLLASQATDASLAATKPDRRLISLFGAPTDVEAST